MTERDFQEAVMEACQTMGLLAYHPRDSRGDDEGFPDTVIVGRRTIYRELKVKGRQPSPDQVLWVEALRAAGQDAAVWTDTQWADGTVLAELENLRPLSARIKALRDRVLVLRDTRRAKRRRHRRGGR